MNREEIVFTKNKIKDKTQLLLKSTKFVIFFFGLLLSVPLKTAAFPP